MKAVYEQIQTNSNESLLFRDIKITKYTGLYHFHPAYELTYIVRGKGMRYVGKQSQNFYDGDMVLLGSNLPHCWIPQSESQQDFKAIVVQFEEETLGPIISNLPELQNIKKLLAKAASGLKISGESRDKIIGILTNISKEPSFKKLFGTLEILELLAQNPQDFQSLDYNFLVQRQSYSETARFQKVFAYIIEHFNEDISLEEVAGVANLSPTSFCRYFKSVTQMTLVELLTNFRLKSACQMIENTTAPITEIAFNSGFSDVTYFNRVFKKQMGTSPLQYRKSLLK
jgi:AraC-like DNA-binding protein/mannose-6-phosphate isomerase-like protein (cupin superfamily)